MINYWDYFMRRKAHLLPITFLFLASGLISCGLLRHYEVRRPAPSTPSTYINIELGDHTEEAPLPNQPAFAVATPAEITALPRVIDIPLTGSPEQPSASSSLLSPSAVTEELTPTPTDHSNNPSHNSEPTANPTLSQIANSAANPVTNPTTSLLPVITLLISLSLIGSFWLYFTYEHFTR